MLRLRLSFGRFQRQFAHDFSLAGVSVSDFVGTVRFGGGTYAN